MKIKARKILAAVLSAAMSVTLLSACKKDGSDVTNAGSSANLSGTVYRSKSSVAGELSGGAAETADGFVLREGRLYFLTSKSESYNENGGYYEKVFYSLNSVNLDGTDLQTVPINNGETAVSNFDFDGEGNVVFIETIFQESGGETSSDYVLKKIKTDGTPVTEIDITNALNEHAAEYFSPESVAVDVSGNIVVDGYLQLIILDSGGNFLFDVKFNNGVRKLVKSSKGEVYASAYGEESYSEFYKINMSEKNIGENIDIVQGYDFDYDIVPYNGYGDGENIFVTDGDNLYNFDLESGVKSEVFNYVNSDIISQEISEIIPIDGGKFIGVGQSYPAKNLQISEIYPVDASTIPEKTEIIVAGSDYSVSSMIEYQAVKFNTASEKYRISIKKYSGEDYVTRLNADLTAGKIPDILLTDNSMPFESYAAKGLFADLYEFIDSDGEMSREDFLPNLLTAMETDGKLYRFTDSFQIFTAIGKTSIFGKEMGIDFGKINEIISSYPEGTEIFAGTTKEDILQHAMELCADEFIDYK
ncbi:MAG: extracellular solute-binding protein, partial [Muribaculaceae bacterium]|nr:extracellular solute-binding protein [Muribaculaceae bacterium]